MDFETFSITPSDLQDEVVDVTPIFAENRVIITYRTKGVEIYDLKDRSCIKSWTQNPATIAAAAAAAAATPSKKKKSAAAATNNNNGQITFDTQTLLQPRSKRLCSVVNGSSLLSWSFSLPSFGDDVLLSLSQQSAAAATKRGSKSAAAASAESAAAAATSSSSSSSLFTATALPCAKGTTACRLLSSEPSGKDSDGDATMGDASDRDLYAVFGDGHVLRIPAGGNGAPEEIFSPGRTRRSAHTALWAQAIRGGRHVLLLLAGASSAASAATLVVIDTAASSSSASVQIPLGGSDTGKVAGCDFDEATASLCVAWASGRWEVLRLAALLDGAAAGGGSAAAGKGPSGSVGNILDVTGVAWAGKDVILVAGTARCDVCGSLALAEGETVVLAVETVYSTVQAAAKTAHPVTRIVRMGPGAAPASVDVALVAATAVSHAALRLIPVTLNTAITSALRLAPALQEKPGAQPRQAFPALVKLIPEKPRPKNGMEVEEEEEESGNEEEEEEEEESGIVDVMAEVQAPFEATDAYSAEWVKGIMEQNAREEAVIAEIEGAQSSAQVTEIAKKYIAEKNAKELKASFGFVRAVEDKLVVAARKAAQEGVDVEGFAALWKDVVVRKLLKCAKAPLTYSYAPRLLQLCMDNSFYGGMEDCLRYMKNIPDELIVKLMAHVIALPDEPPKAVAEEEKKPVFGFETFDPRNRFVRIGFLTPKEYLLSMLITLPRNEVFAHKYIKSFSKQDITVNILYIFILYYM